MKHRNVSVKLSNEVGGHRQFWNELYVTQTIAIVSIS